MRVGGDGVGDGGGGGFMEEGWEGYLHSVLLARRAWRGRLNSHDLRTLCGVRLGG